MPDEFDFDLKLLPPRLQVRLWVLALDANTSRVNLAYNPGSFRTSLAYNYGGNVEASLAVPRLTATLGVNPSSGDLSLGMVFRGFNFRTNASFVNGSAGLSIGYGSPLLPFPQELSAAFNSAAGGIQNMAGNIGSAANNPLAWYRLHSNDIGTVSEAVSLGQRIGSQSSPGFGAALRINYTPVSGLTLFGGVQLVF